MLSEQMNCYKNKKDLLRAKLGTIPLIFDGGMGSQLNLKGLRPGEITDECNILHPEWVSDIQASYLEAGASCILTNTLGSNRFHLADSQFSLREIIEAAIRNGREAIDREETRCRRQGIDKSCFLIYDIGSLGQLMEPSGSLSFENAYEAFKEQILILGDQVDAILIETVSDIYEMKAAVLAAKENSDLPIFSSMTFGESGKTLMGTTPTAMVTFLEGIGVDCLGINCSLGPKEMEPIVEEILSVARIPVIVQPNAGLPVFSGNETVYNVSVEEFCEYIYKFVKAGVSVVGGCCGTTPEYIRGISNLLQNEKLARRVNSPRTCISSGSVSVTLGERIAICGERLNPTGRKLLRQAILEKRYDVLLLEAASQEQSGAHVLDVNVGVPGIDEPAVMAKVVKSLQEVIRLPLQIDSSNPEALEKKREALFDEILDKALAYKIVFVGPEIIDRDNILNATMSGMKQAAEGLDIVPNLVLVDGNRVPAALEIPAQPVVKGDATSASIGAASILAKVSRDRYMMELDKQYPQYQLAKHKGYPTRLHYELIEQYGIQPSYRRSFLKKQGYWPEGK